MHISMLVSYMLPTTATAKIWKHFEKGGEITKGERTASPIK